MDQILVTTSKGIYCPKGDFYIDPWKPVKQAVVSHAHSDHLHLGNKNYYVSTRSKELTEHRLSYSEKDYSLHTYEFDETFEINGVTVSLHPAGHILGSAQIRVEVGNQVAVMSGDYKLDKDPTCLPFELQKCDQFISEATFGLPIYRWQPGKQVVKDIYDWWQRNAIEEKPSVIFCYSLGKGQRILAELNNLIQEDEEIYLHGALVGLTKIYEDLDINLAKTKTIPKSSKNKFTDNLIIGPPSSFRSAWMKRFKNNETAFASGWMRVRGRRRMAGYDKGFVMSDHADWPGLVSTILKTGANDVTLFATRSTVLERYLVENHGLQATTMLNGLTEEDD